jgi:putative acetyltransferase
MNRQSESWTFRASRPSDADQIYAVWHASVTATHDFLTEADFRNICESERRDYLPANLATVAVVVDDRVIGFMEHTSAEITSLFIGPAFQARGLGRAFMRLANSWSSSLDVTVNAQNAQAVGFYEAMGFVAFASAPLDEDGRPYPILRMRGSVDQESSHDSRDIPPA